MTEKLEPVFDITENKQHTQHIVLSETEEFEFKTILKTFNMTKVDFLRRAIHTNFMRITNKKSPR
jgi:hypothetical protein